jgi:hypothetical protein
MAPDDESHPEEDVEDWDPRDDSRGRDRGVDDGASLVASASTAASLRARRVTSSDSESGVRQRGQELAAASTSESHAGQ